MVANNDRAIEITEKEFEDTIVEKEIVVIDFYADWCMPCLMIAPIVEELANQLKEIKFARVNIDENQKLSDKFKITSIPCLVIFKSGKEVERITGALPEEVLEEKIVKYAAPKVLNK